MSNILVDLVTDVFTFDVDIIHRPKKARGNEKDKLPSGVESRPNDQQTSTPDTEPRSQTAFRGEKVMVLAEVYHALQQWHSIIPTWEELTGMINCVGTTM